MNAFIHQFAETHVAAFLTPLAENSSRLGTTTMTATKEQNDQDMHSYSFCSEAFTLGTQTLTETVEGADQDRANSCW